jgi:RND family efflux transporter MFP subunit
MIRRCHPIDVSAAGLLACCLMVATALLAGCKPQAPAETAVPPIRVSVATSIEDDFVDYEEFTGTTKVNAIDIHARVSGYLDKVLFVDGSEVTKDQPLFQIDPRPFQAAVDRATAEVALNTANLKYRETEVNRNRPLVAKAAISQSEFDQLVAAAEQATASVAAAKAALADANLNLGFALIISPIDGRISRTSIAAGNLVKADQTLLTTVVPVDPMFVYFDVDEHTLLEVQREIREGRIKTSDHGRIPVLMGLANEKGFPHEGTLDFAENQLDRNTGTYGLRAVFANPKPAEGNRLLMPGMNCRIRLPLGEPQKVLKVAERAIGTDQSQKFLYVVNAQNKVEYRPVSLGRSENSLRVVYSGVQAGEKVVVSGLQRVRDGATAEPHGVEMKSFMEKPEK